ncbi:MAG: hypothetical protein H8D67_12470, partial [Deltaproteobacteria bacterium]|nr:hypothetical protein [Deltaproteobacteria bacterium]
SMYGRADTIVKHPDLIEELKEIGLQYLTIGIESIEDNALKKLNKKTSVEINNEAIKILQKLGLNNVAHFIINPNYMKKDFNNVFNYVRDMNLFQPVFTVLTPLPGTELFTKEHDRLYIKNWDFFDFVHSVLPTKLSRIEFYHQLVGLYLKCYSFKRYFKSIFQDMLSWIKRSKNLNYNTDRLSLLKMIILHIVGAYSGPNLPPIPVKPATCSG